MATLQAKVGVLVLLLVAAAAAGTSNGKCDYLIKVRTSNEQLWAGTDASVILGLYNKNGTGWKAKVPGKDWRLNRGSTTKYINKGALCFDPCHITLALANTRYINTWGSTEWYPETIWVYITDAGVQKEDFGYFDVRGWIKHGKTYSFYDRVMCWDD